MSFGGWVQVRWVSFGIGGIGRVFRCSVIIGWVFQLRPLLAGWVSPWRLVGVLLSGVEIMGTGFHPVWETILRSCMKNYFFECLTSILEKFSYLRYHTLVYEKSQSSPPSLMALTASSPGSEYNSIILAVRG